MREKLGDRDYVIEGADMYVNVPEFSKPELVGYAKIWLENQGFEQVSCAKATSPSSTARTSTRE